MHDKHTANILNGKKLPLGSLFTQIRSYFLLILNPTKVL